MNIMPREKPDGKHRIILSVSPDQEDHATLRHRLMQPIWSLYVADSVSSARKVLEAHNVAVVLCERDLIPGNWTEMLDVLMEIQNSPPLIVTSRLADDKLWSEALTRGAYDVLAKPFYQEDLLRSLHLAW
jgi:DNA-binding NtrC family response regulator